jgi:hypothetical protein
MILDLRLKIRILFESTRENMADAILILEKIMRKKDELRLLRES